MIEVVGTISIEDLQKMKARGLSPKEAVDSILSESDTRYPNDTPIIRKAESHSGYDIVIIKDV